MSGSEAAEVFWSVDADELARAVAGVIGQPCWKAELTYGDELTLHLGDRVPYSSPRMAGRHKGAWILGARASDWSVRRDGQTVGSSDAPALSEGALPGMIEGAAVSAFEPSADDSGVRIAFDNGAVLTIIPGADEDWDLAAWELFTPDHFVVSRGPGLVWEKSRSDRLPDFTDAVRDAQRWWTETLAAHGQLSDWQTPWDAITAALPGGGQNEEVFFHAASARLGKAVQLCRVSNTSLAEGGPSISTRRVPLSDLVSGECFVAVCGSEGLDAEIRERLLNFLLGRPVVTPAVP